MHCRWCGIIATTRCNIITTCCRLHGTSTMAFHTSEACCLIFVDILHSFQSKADLKVDFREQDCRVWPALIHCGQWWYRNFVRYQSQALSVTPSMYSDFFVDILVPVLSLIVLVLRHAVLVLFLQVVSSLFYHFPCYLQFLTPSSIT